MHIMRCLFCGLVALAAWAAASPVAQAHFLWITTGEDQQVHVWFAETPEAGEAHLVEKLAKAEAWQRSAEGKSHAVKLTARKDEQAGTGELTGVAGIKAGATEATYNYGVFKRGDNALLLSYYAKHLRAEDVAKHSQLGRAEQLALDIVPMGETAQILWQGKPAAEVETVVWTPDGKSSELRSDADGKVAIGSGAGRYAIRARLVEPDKQGTLDGQEYKQAWHVATLVWDAGTASTTAAAKAEPGSALELLTKAREERSVWHDFPGFRSAVRATIDDQVYQGTVILTPEGKVELEGLDTPDATWIRQQMALVVSHRMPGELEKYAVSFADENANHPLGRLVKLVDDPANSLYRVRDGVVTEVNRDMGPTTRFTISVLEVTRNAEGQYLPTSFSVSYWNKESEQLKSSEAYLHSWTRVGKFDLPAKMLTVLTGKGTRRVMELDFSEWKPLTDKSVATK